MLHVVQAGRGQIIPRQPCPKYTALTCREGHRDSTNHNAQRVVSRPPHLFLVTEIRNIVAQPFQLSVILKSPEDGQPRDRSECLQQIPNRTPRRRQHRKKCRLALPFNTTSIALLSRERAGAPNPGVQSNIVFAVQFI